MLPVLAGALVAGSLVTLVGAPVVPALSGPEALSAPSLVVDVVADAAGWIGRLQPAKVTRSRERMILRRRRSGRAAGSGTRSFRATGGG